MLSTCCEIPKMPSDLIKISLHARYKYLKPFYFHTTFTADTSVRKHLSFFSHYHIVNLPFSPLSTRFLDLLVLVTGVCYLSLLRWWILAASFGFAVEYELSALLLEKNFRGFFIYHICFSEPTRRGRKNDIDIWQVFFLHCSILELESRVLD